MMRKLMYWRHFAAILLLSIASAGVCTKIEAAATQPESAAVADANIQTAIFAGGCFWCTESDFDKMPGVISTTSGYTGGTLINPTYEQVSAGGSGHVEAVKVRFDAAKTSFPKLLEAFWLTIDPLTADGQFCDRGPQYRSVIFYYDAEQKAWAENSKKRLEASARFTQPIVTEILPVTEFYPAEEYHQDYYLKNPLRYAFYRKKCGRDKRLEELWGVKHQ